MDRYHVSPPQAIDRWPGRDELLKLRQQNSELVLRNCVDIIDYFKNFIEKPTNLMVRAQTWSNYKHHNMVKYLIGTRPQVQ